MYKKKNIIIVVMLVAVLFMAVGYAILQTQLKINGTANVTGSWNVAITNVTSTATGRAYNIKSPTYTATNMTFSVGVKEPGDKMTFKVTVKNSGNIGAILDTIDATASGSAVIKYAITGIQSKTKLAVGASITFTVTTEFDINASIIPEDPVKELTIKLNYIQDDGQTLTPQNPTIEGENTLVQKILSENVPKTDVGLDFSKDSGTSNGVGLYYTSTNTEGNKTTYYFRGNVTNNYVKFAGIDWRIVRINEDGSVRLIRATGTTNIAFNSTGSDNAYVGYMYGTTGASTYEAAHTNTHSSTIKTKIDEWYQANLASYSSYLADAGFCNDRSTVSGLGYSTNSTSYAGYSRLVSNAAPVFKCPNATRDLFTTSASSKGNRALTYPVGLITADEVIFAGAGTSSDTHTHYLSQILTHTMTPLSGGSSSQIFVVSGKPQTGVPVTAIPFGYAPVISLKSNVMVTTGNGTSSSPYVIKTS